LTPVVNWTNILQAAFALKFLDKKLQSQTVSKEKFQKTLLHEKGTRKTMVKLTPGSRGRFPPATSMQ
jgi:hypothetical protein